MLRKFQTRLAMKEGGFFLLSILVSSLVLNCQSVTVDNIPVSEYVIASEGKDISLYCLTLNNDMSQAQTLWGIQKPGGSLRATIYNGTTGEVTEPPEYIEQLTATGELIPGLTVTYQTNFTLLNFTREFDLAQITCGTGNPGENFIYTLGLPIVPSLLTNGSQTSVEGNNVSVNLQGGTPNAFPPTITSSQLSLNGIPVSNTGVTVNDYTVSFINVQRNQSGIYTLTVSNDAGTSNTTFTLDVQFPPEATLIGTDIQYVQSSASVTVSLFNNINGNPTPTVTWTGPNGQIIPNGGRFTVDNVTGTLSITSFTSDDNGTYTSTVNNNIGTSLVDTMDLILAVPSGPPIGLTTDDITDTNVTLDWSPPTDIGTPPFNYYRINMSPAPPPDVILNTTSTSLRVWGIIPGTYYNVSVVSVTINDALTGSLVGESSNITTFRTMLGAPMFQSVNAMADNGFINVSWTFRHTGGQEIDDIKVLCSTSGEGSSGDMVSCTMNDCGNSNLMGSTSVGPITAGLSYSCRITAINANGTDDRNIDNIVPTEGIPSSPAITDNGTSPGLLVLRVHTVYPGDVNIRFIVNITNVSDGSIISSTAHQFNNYQPNDTVDINISIPNGGSVSVSIVTINQYGASDIINVLQVFTIDPISIITTSVIVSISTATISIVNTPSTTLQTVDRSGLSSGAIAGITISIFILLVVFIILIIIIIILQYLHIRKKSAGKKEVTVLGNISSIPSVSNEAYAAVDSIVNVQENVAYSLPQRHTIAAANPPTAALYETINI